jgi:hypothetical protein
MHTPHSHFLREYADARHADQESHERYLAAADELARLLGALSNTAVAEPRQDTGPDEKEVKPVPFSLPCADCHKPATECTCPEPRTFDLTFNNEL